jgi:Transposase DDE domain group 1
LDRTRPPARCHNQRRTATQWIKEGKNAIKWTRLACRSMKANGVRLQLHALAYNLANFVRTLALPEAMARWSMTTIREKLVKIGAKVVAHARYTVFQMAEVACPRRCSAGSRHDRRPSNAAADAMLGAATTGTLNLSESSPSCHPEVLSEGRNGPTPRQSTAEAAHLGNHG